MIKLTAKFYADDLRFNQLITHSGESPYVFRPNSTQMLLGIKSSNNGDGNENVSWKQTLRNGDYFVIFAFSSHLLLLTEDAANELVDAPLKEM